ncbi:hypothetical protein [Paracoccus sp. KR1-242]|uniref:hypothetical protein n=1 Tax=Paracoccus sp. KR1-242 TaxID=3410028 RepID=UPI003BFD0B84
MALCCCSLVQKDDHQNGERTRDDEGSCRVLRSLLGRILSDEAAKPVEVINSSRQPGAKPLSELRIVKSALADRGHLQSRRLCISLDLGNDDVRVHASAYLAFAKASQLANAKLRLTPAKIYPAAMAMHPISQRIKALMDERGMTKADLHHATGIPYHRLNPWFIRDNAKPNAEDTELVATALTTQATYLITGEVAPIHDERSWIVSVYDSLPPEKQAQLEGFARFLAQETMDSQGTEQKRKGSQAKADPDL